MQPEQWHTALKDHDITHIAHGATVTPISRGSVAEQHSEPEAQDPRRIIEINTMGTVALLEWARTLPDLRRSLPSARAGSIRSTGRIGRRAPSRGRLCDAAASLRHFQAGRRAHHRTLWRSVPPVDRLRAALVGLRSDGSPDPDPQLPARAQPDCAARAHGAGCVRVNTLDAIGDYVHVEDVARAIIALMAVPDCATAATTLPQDEPAASATSSAGRRESAWITAEVVAPELADVLQDATLRDGMWVPMIFAHLRRDALAAARRARAMHAYMTGWSPSGVPTSRLPPARPNEST